MPTVAMPDWVVSCFAALGDMPEEEYETFLRAFGSAGPTLSTSAVAKAVIQRSKLTYAEAHMLVHALIGLAGTANTGDTSDTLADRVATSPDLEKTGTDTNALADRVSTLLDVTPLRLLGKAHDLNGEHAHIFLDARLITDIRPIFGPEAEALPEGALLSHTLKLEFLRNQGEVEHFYLALDEDDLNKMSDLINRARRKSASLRSVLSRVDITHIGLES